MTQTMPISYSEVQRLYAEYSKRLDESDAALAEYRAKREAEDEARQAWMTASEDYFASAA